MKKDILQVAFWSAVLCIVMDLLFFLFGFFDITALWGTLIGYACAVLNLCFLAVAVKKAVEKSGRAGMYMGTSYLIRLMAIAVVVVASIKSPYINYVAVVIPLIFPRVIITVIQGIMKHSEKSGTEEGDSVGRA